MRTGLTVAAVIAATTLTPAPATAGEGNYFSRLACVSYDGHKSCQQVNWSKRRGRHGVTLQRFKITTASEEPANFHQYKDVTLKWRAKGGGPVDYTYELGTEPKTVYRDVSNASPGRARVHGPHVLRRGRHVRAGRPRVPRPRRLPQRDLASLTRLHRRGAAGCGRTRRRRVSARAGRWTRSDVR